MTRPESVDDLTPDQRRGPEFASFDLGAFPINGELLRVAAKFLDLASVWGNKYPVAGVEIAREGMRINCYATPSARDLQATLETAQRGWDYACNKRVDALTTGECPDEQTAWLIEQWCAREGLDLPWSERS